MLRFARRTVGVAAFTLVICSASSLWAVSPNPLQTAYWRFDDPGATAGTRVAGGNIGAVQDSVNQNHLRAQDAGTAPKYVSDVAPTPLKSGLQNSLAFNFSAAEDGIQDDLFTDTKDINNGQIGDPHAPDLTGFTLEAAFRPSVVAGFQAIAGREGQPNGPLETMELKIRGEGLGNDHLLQVEQFDRAGNLVEVHSNSVMEAGRWYYVAVVNDGTSVKMYLDSNDGTGYHLQDDTAAVAGALYQGGDANDWDKTWSVGRGWFNGHVADWFNGEIDEVRLSNKALAPWEFLFSRQGEYNGDNKINAGDYVGWRKSNIFGDDGYTLWRKHFEEDPAAATGLGPAAVPEPASILVAALAVIGVSGMRSTRRSGIRRR